MKLYDRKTAERDLHDRLRGAGQYDPVYHSNKKFYSINQSNVEYVKSWLTARARGCRVLDYCCGNGDDALWLAEAGADVYGIDISPVSIGNAKAAATARGIEDRTTFRVMDAEATEFPDNYFDLVVINGVLHHLDLHKAYRELARILKPDGEVIATEALRHNMFIHLYRKLTPHLRSAWETDHILGKEEILAAKKYFRHVQIERFFHLATLVAVPFRGLSFFEPVRRGLEALDSFLLRLPGVKWQAWMVVFVLGSPNKRPSK
jgi:ubiquinone/menaquinone biosynthesis C-methylase UbiE